MLHATHSWQPAPSTLQNPHFQVLFEPAVIVYRDRNINTYYLFLVAAVLKEYGLDKLPPMPRKGGLYKRTLKVGDLLYVSGHGPLLEGGLDIRVNV